MLSCDPCEGLNLHPCQPMHAGRSLPGPATWEADSAETSGPPARSVRKHFPPGPPTHHHSEGFLHLLWWTRCSRRWGKARSRVSMVLTISLRDPGKLNGYRKLLDFSLPRFRMPCLTSPGSRERFSWVTPLEWPKRDITWNFLKILARFFCLTNLPVFFPLWFEIQSSDLGEWGEPETDLQWKILELRQMHFSSCVYVGAPVCEISKPRC